MPLLTLPTRLQSLRAKVLLCLMLGSGTVALLGVWRITFVYGWKLEQQLQARSEAVADAVGHYAATVRSPNDLQLFVEALGASRDVRSVIILAGDPLRALASDNSSRSGLESLPELSTSQKGILEAHGRLRLADHAFDWFAPATIAQQGSPNKPLAGIVVVVLDTYGLEAELSTARGRIAMMLFALVGLTAGITFGMLHFSVLVPARDLVEAILRRAGGQTNAYARVFAPDELGSVAKALNTMLDRLDRKEAERRAALESLLRSHEEVAAARQLLEQQTTALQRQNEELQQARLKAEAASQAKNAFLANVSHEIRTPMTAILGFTEMLAASVPPQQLELVQTIERNGEHLLTIINDILDLSKIEADRMELELLPLDPAALLEDVLTLMRIRASAKGLSLASEPHGDLPPRIISDPTRLRQILINLIGNAIKFTERGGVRVRVGLEEGDAVQRRLFFEVVDTGIGMTAEQIEVLFHPFMQADNSTTRRFGGTGLGLTISQRFAQMLGGSISVVSEPGQGSTFRVTIAKGAWQEPACERTPPAERAALPSEMPSTGVELAGRRLLLAEDGPDNQRIVAFLARKAGAEMIVVDNGRLAVERIAAGESFDVILLDMQMPVMDGYEAAAAIRALGYDRPILALTAHAMRGDREQCLAAGCDDYCTKPVQRQTLVNVLRRLAESPRASSVACPPLA